MHRSAAAAIAAISALVLSGCVTPMAAERQARLDGVVVFAFVNVEPSEENSKQTWSSTLAKQHCKKFREPWCADPSGYDFVSALISNTYWGGGRFVGSFVPKAEGVRRNDIIVARLRAGAGAEFIRVASRGERPDCRWVGGGVTRALTAAGVICEDYDWRTIAGLLYD